MKDVSYYLDYTEFLKDWILSRPRKGHGVKVRMAQHLGCIPTQITKVLKREIHLTLDQAAKLTSFLELSQLEGHYFFGLVELGRAGSMEMKSLVQERLDELKINLQEKERFADEIHELSGADYEIYYEKWYFSAIEMLSAISKFQTVDSLSEHLNLPKKEVLKVLNFLVKKDLLKKEENKYIRDLRSTWVAPHAPIYKTKHHLNWRTRGLSSFDQKVEENNMNLTILLTLSKDDIPRLIDYFHKTGGEVIKSVEGNPREELRCITIDFFKV